MHVRALPEEKVSAACNARRRRRLTPLGDRVNVEEYVFEKLLRARLREIGAGVDGCRNRPPVRPPKRWAARRQLGLLLVRLGCRLLAAPVPEALIASDVGRRRASMHE